MSGPDYHAWTHRPKVLGGTDPIESAASLRPWVVLQGGGWDIANNTDSQVVVDELYWDPTLLPIDDTDPTNDQGGIFTFDTATDTLNSQDYFRVTNRDAGWFTVEWALAFEYSGVTSANTAAYAMGYVFPVANTGGGFIQDRATSMKKSADWPLTSEATGVNEFIASTGQLMGYRTVWIAAQRLWQFGAKQTSGSTVSVAGHMKIWHEPDAFGGDPDNGNWGFSSL